MSIRAPFRIEKNLGTPCYASIVRRSRRSAAAVSAAVDGPHSKLIVPS